MSCCGSFDFSVATKDNIITKVWKEEDVNIVSHTSFD